MSIHPLTFPLDALPNTARNAAYELLQNTGAPDVIVGMSVLASMSIAAQLNYDVQLPHGVVRPTGSTFICLALPSQQKTTVDELVMKPFLDLDKAAATAQQLQRKAYRTKKDLYSLVRQGMLREIVKGEIAGESTDKLRTRLAEHEAGEPVPVQGGRIIYSNTTHRAFLEAMQGEGRFTALLSNEGEAVLISPPVPGIRFSEQRVGWPFRARSGSRERRLCSRPQPTQRDVSDASASSLGSHDGQTW